MSPTTPHLLDEKRLSIFFHSLYFMCAICFISETEVSEFFGRMDELILRRLSFHHMWRGVYFHTRTHTCASICSCHNIDHAVLVCPLAIRTAKLLCYVFCICGVGNKRSRPCRAPALQRELPMIPPELTSELLHCLSTLPDPWPLAKLTINMESASQWVSKMGRLFFADEFVRHTVGTYTSKQLP